LRNTQPTPEELDAVCTPYFVNKQTFIKMLTQAQSLFAEVYGKLKFVEKGQNLAVMNRMTFTL